MLNPSNLNWTLTPARTSGGMKVGCDPCILSVFDPSLACTIIFFPTFIPSQHKRRNMAWEALQWMHLRRDEQADLSILKKTNLKIDITYTDEVVSVRNKELDCFIELQSTISRSRIKRECLIVEAFELIQP